MYDYKKREIGLIMRKNGFKFHHQTGSHAIYKNDKGEHISIGMCKCNGAIMHKLSKKHNLDLQYRGKNKYENNKRETQSSKSIH